jgi:hypothetical protein
MLASLALMTTLHLATEPVGQLKLTNDRATHGVLGWERKDSKSPKVYPGDVLFIRFDVEGLKVGEDGQALYSMEMVIADKDGKELFRKDPEDEVAVLGLGGTALPMAPQAVIGTDTKPGTYTMKVTVTDRAVKKSESLMRTFEVVPPQLGFVRLTVTYANNQLRDTGLPAPPVAVPGQNYNVGFAVVGFTLDTKNNQPTLSVEMRVLDESGKPVLGKPFVGGTNFATEQFKKIFPMEFMLKLNRPGKYKIALKVTDMNNNKKTAEETLDFTVAEPK